MALKKVKKITPVNSSKKVEDTAPQQKEETPKVTSFKKFTIQSVQQMAEEYTEVSKKIALLTETKKTLAENIKLASETLGTKDDKGSFYVECDTYIVGKQAKKSVSLDESKAIAFIKKNKKNLVGRVIETIEKVNENALKNEVMGGTITKEEFQSLVVSKTQYAVSVTKKEEMPDVEVGSLAASRKK